MEKWILIFVLITNVYSGLTEEQRNKLLKKVTKYVSYQNEHQPVTQYYHRGKNSSAICEPSKIKEIIKKYNFPETYNFIDDVKPTVHIKNQEQCGACWAFASTTALAYRFKKKGIDVDLSPQYGLSCYSNDCKAGDYLINTMFNLVKNGSVSETCFPYNSGNGEIVDTCPSQCKNGETFVKYHGKGGYSTENDFSKENYYDIVTLIMDQLTTYGPVMSGIIVYEDFLTLAGIDCKNTIYKYNGLSETSSGHAVVIVGYGVRDNQYYWIIQNSWGEGFCDGGFAKIGFGEINIEMASFLEPYIESPDSSGKTISVTVNEIDGNCLLKYTSSEDIDGSFEIYFKKGDSSFYYQCGSISKNAREGVCSFSQPGTLNQEGIYTYSSHSSLLNKDTYNLQFNSKKNQFYFYGLGYIDGFFERPNHYYVSEEENNIILYYRNDHHNINAPVNNIYMNKNTEKPFSDCTLITIGVFNLVSCDLKPEEVKNIPTPNNLPLAYDIFCGTKEQMLSIIHYFDKTRYPIFNIKELIIPEHKYIKPDSVFYVNIEVTGDLSNFSTKDFGFGAFLKMEIDPKIFYDYILCYSETIPTSATRSKYTVPCTFDLAFIDSYAQNIYLTPYIFPFPDEVPYRISLKNELKGKEDVIKRMAGSSLIIHMNLLFFLFLLIIL